MTEHLDTSKRWETKDARISATTLESRVVGKKFSWTEWEDRCPDFVRQYSVVDTLPDELLLPSLVHMEARMAHLSANRRFDFICADDSVAKKLMEHRRHLRNKIRASRFTDVDDFLKQRGRNLKAVPLVVLFVAGDAQAVSTVAQDLARSDIKDHALVVPLKVENAEYFAQHLASDLDVAVYSGNAVAVTDDLFKYLVAMNTAVMTDPVVSWAVNEVSLQLQRLSASNWRDIAKATYSSFLATSTLCAIRVDNALPPPGAAFAVAEENALENRDA